LKVENEAKDASWSHPDGVTQSVFLEPEPFCCILFSDLDFKGARTDPICNNRGGEQKIHRYGGELFSDN